MTNTQQTVILNCDVCAGEIELDKDTILHELLECMDCGTEFEVVSLQPPRLNEAPMEAEDWGQ